MGEFIIKESQLNEIVALLQEVKIKHAYRIFKIIESLKPAEEAAK